MLIRNARDCAGKPIEVWLRDGKIAAVGLGLLVPEGEEVLDAKRRTLLPAFIDTHCHWRTPGFEYKEDISTGSAAAAAGGYTFVTVSYTHLDVYKRQLWRIVCRGRASAAAQ